MLKYDFSFPLFLSLVGNKRLWETYVWRNQEQRRPAFSLWRSLAQNGFFVGAVRLPADGTVNRHRAEQSPRHTIQSVWKQVQSSWLRGAAFDVAL